MMNRPVRTRMQRVVWGPGEQTSLLPDYVLSSTDQRSPSATSLMILFRSLSKAAIYRVRNSLSATLPNNPKGAW